MLEERVANVATARYVWSPVYVDALVLRDRDTNADGVLDERLYAVQDANWNVVALVDTAGAVQERFATDPFGSVTVYSPTYTVRTGGSLFGWVINHQGMRYDGVAGLYHQRARWLSPTLGRWTTTDPLMFQAGDNNFYRFVGNNPVNGLDPSGLYEGLFWSPSEAWRYLNGVAAGMYRDGENFAGDLLSYFLDKKNRSGPYKLTQKNIDEVKDHSKTMVEYWLKDRYGKAGDWTSDGVQKIDIPKTQVNWSGSGYLTWLQPGQVRDDNMSNAYGGARMTVTGKGCRLNDGTAIANVSVTFEDEYTFRPDDYKRMVFTSYHDAHYLEKNHGYTSFTHTITFDGTYKFKVSP